MGWTTPKTWNPGDVLSASDFNTQIRDNLLALKNSKIVAVHAYTPGSDYTYNGSAWANVDATNVKVTITPEGARIAALALFSANANVNQANGPWFGLALSGSTPGSDYESSFPNGGGMSVFHVFTSGIVAGSANDIVLMWHSNSTQVATLYGTYIPIVLWAWEL